MGANLKPPNRAIVTELVSRGSLWDVLRMQNLFPGYSGQSHWPNMVIRRVLEDTIRGLNYLHGNDPPIIHRDLKSANLLLDDSFHVKICDFGLARIRDYSVNLTANVGTAQWMAPEVIAGMLNIRLRCTNHSITDTIKVYRYCPLLSIMHVQCLCSPII